MATPGEINFNIFQETTRDNIRVGYISTERGFIRNVTIPDANCYAKKNPGTTFILDDRDGVRYLNINEVNALTIGDIEPKKSASSGNCNPVVGLNEIDRFGAGSDDYRTRVHFYGGGGVGAKANPVIGSDGSVLAIDLEEGGFGYKYAPYVRVDDDLDIGSGAVVRAILCEIESVTQYFSTEKDFEEYFCSDGDEVGFGQRFTPEGTVLGEWNPRIYANTDKNPFRRELDKYQRFLSQLTKPWWSTRKEDPLSVTSPNTKNRIKYNSKHPAWGEFMNRYSISPVPVTNRRGSDFAGIPYTFEWEENFPYDGEYVFRGACDNVGQLYLDSSKVMDLGGFKGNGSKLKKFMKSGVHKIRLDLYNIPIRERIIKESKEVGSGCPTTIKFHITTAAGFANRIQIPGLNINVGKQTGGPQLNETFDRQVERGKEYDVIISSRESRNIRLRTRGESVLQVEESTDNDWQDLVCTVSCGRFINISGNKCKLIFDAPKTIETERREVITGNSTSSQGEKTNIFNTLDYIRKANRKLWKMNPGSRRGSDFLNRFGVLPFDPGKEVVQDVPTSNAKLEKPQVKLVSNGRNISLKVTGNGQVKVNFKLKVDDNLRTSGVFAKEVIINTDSNPVKLKREIKTRGRGIDGSTYLTGKERETIYGSGVFTAGKSYDIKVIGGSPTSGFKSIDSRSIGFDDDINNGFDKNGLLEIVSTKAVREPINKVQTARSSAKKTNYPNKTSDSFAGTHPIIWQKVDFPQDGNYNIEVMADDNATIWIGNRSAGGIANDGSGRRSVSEGGDEVIITKRGFSATGKSTGKSSYVRYFKKGSYRIRVDLEQKPGKGLSDGNPMGVAINISTAGAGEEVVSAKSWMENPMGVALTIDAPLPPIPQEPIPKQEGRCPNNPIWTTRYPGASSRWWPVVDTLGRWGKFQDRYAISPVPPLAEKGTDNGGIIYRNRWSIEIPYEGFYGLQGTVDNAGRILIDGKEQLVGGYFSGAKFGGKSLQGFNTENPNTKKIFLSKGRHTIEVELENYSQEITKNIKKVIFDTARWIGGAPQRPQQQPRTVTTTQDVTREEWVRVDDVYVPPTAAAGGGRGRRGLVISSDTTFHQYHEGTYYKGKKIRPGGDWNDTNPNTNYIEWDKDTRLTLGSYHGRRFGIAVYKKKVTTTKVQSTSTVQPKPAGASNISTSKNGVTYNGPRLASYEKSELGPFVTPAYINDDDYKNNFQGKTWSMKWTNVDFPVRGQYQIQAKADDVLRILVDGIEVGKAQVFEGVVTSEFTADAGKKTVELILKNANVPKSTYANNPTKAACKITTNVTVSDGTQSWKLNPMGISAALIPPPCPKEVRGQGIVCRVVVDDPGNGYAAPPGEGYPVALKLRSVEVENPGINYNCGVDQLQITPSNGAVLDYECDPFGKIRRVKVLDGGFGFTRYPEITMVSDTGVNASFRPQFEVIRDPIVADEDKLIQVTDLIGLEQTGYVRGRPYYGAVFYKDGVRYAGYYETPGDLVQVYDTLQESIDGVVTTKPSAIQRQGTNIQSNDPRLNIPGTPENLS